MWQRPRTRSHCAAQHAGWRKAGQYNRSGERVDGRAERNSGSSSTSFNNLQRGRNATANLCVRLISGAGGRFRCIAANVSKRIRQRRFCILHGTLFLQWQRLSVGYSLIGEKEIVQWLVK